MPGYVGIPCVGDIDVFIDGKLAFTAKDARLVADPEWVNRGFMGLRPDSVTIQFTSLRLPWHRMAWAWVTGVLWRKWPK